MSNELTVRKWDASKIKPKTLILNVGARGSGKTTLIRDQCYFLRDKIDFVMAFSPTEDTTETLKEMVPGAFIFNDYREDSLNELMDLQRKFGQVKKNFYPLIILDDCCYDKKILRTKLIREIFMNGRHRNITLMISAQYIMDMPPDLRSQIDYTFVFSEGNIKNKEKLWKQFFGLFERYKHFNKMLNELTVDYQCLVSDKKTYKDNSIQNRYFWYKADINRPKFVIGRPIFWKMDKFYEKKQVFTLPELPSKKKQSTQELGKELVSVIKTDENGKSLI